MNRTLALARTRRLAYTKTQRLYAPLIAALTIVLVAQAGGPTRPDQAYAFTAALLFGVFGWQAKAVLDTEPDTQRLVDRLMVGSSRREIVAGLLASAVSAVPIIVIAVFAPVLAGVIGLSRHSLLPWLGFGLWIHILSAVTGTAVGMLASRAIVRRQGRAVAILLAAFIAVLVLGSRETAIPRWLVPQLVEVSDNTFVSAVLATAHAFVWSGLLIFWYARLRRTRA